MLNKTNYEQKFKEWFIKFAGSDLFANMSATKEASSWHKEENVGVHTCMVVDEYIARSPESWTKKDFLGAIHCAFHDTGKPMAEEIVEKDDGTIRRRYGGHEIYSARFFVDYVYSDYELLALLDDSDVYNIAVMIQSHIPYNLRTEKLRQIKTHLVAFGLEDIFARCILADTYGRISDEQEPRIVKACEWVEQVYNNALPLELVNERVPRVVLMCAPTGSGKSTIVNEIITSYNMIDKAVGVHSMDQCRLDWYSSDYEEAFKLSVEDKGFNNCATRDFWEKTKTSDVVIVDNTNISPKRRRRYATPNTHAVVFLLDYATNHLRFMSRADKKIGKHVLDQMYWNFKLPVLGEVDKIFIVSQTGKLGQTCLRTN